MATYKDVIEDLKEIGREDAIEALGVLYERKDKRLMPYMTRESVTSAAWIRDAVCWLTAQHLSGISFNSVYYKLQSLDKNRGIK